MVSALGVVLEVCDLGLAQVILNYCPSVRRCPLAAAAEEEVSSLASAAPSDGRGTTDRRPVPPLRRGLARRRQRVVDRHRRDSVPAAARPAPGQSVSRVIAKFHCTGPTGPDRTGPDQTKSTHFVGDRLNSTARARPDPTGPARTFLRPGSSRNSVGSVWVSDKVRAGLCGSGRARVVEFSLYL